MAISNHLETAHFIRALLNFPQRRRNQADSTGDAGIGLVGEQEHNGGRIDLMLDADGYCGSAITFASLPRISAVEIDLGIAPLDLLPTQASASEVLT